MPSHPANSPIPVDTANVAKAAYSRSNVYLSIGDRLVALLSGLRFDHSGQPAASYRLVGSSLALITFFQYQEKLSDRQAAEAIRTRIDWKYALHLSMNHPGCSPSALCSFRQSLYCQPEERQEFQKLLERLWKGPCEPDAPEQAIEAANVLDEVCVRTRLDVVMTSMLNVLQALAIRYPEWLRSTSLPYWYSRYEMANRGHDLTMGKQQQKAMAEATGADISYLLEAVKDTNSPELETLNEVQELYRVRAEQFEVLEGELVLKRNTCASCSYQDLSTL